jgi:tetratricopeptide (TPR) repeat protein
MSLKPMAMLQPMKILHPNNLYYSKLPISIYVDIHYIPRMKTTILSLFLGCLSLAAYAQPNKVQSAIIYIRYGEFDKAKVSIDEAIEHPKTQNSAKAWFYRGEVHLGIYGDTAWAPKFPEALDVAWESYRRCIELDTKNDHTEDANKKIQNIQAGFYNEGVEAYIQKDYPWAIKRFEQLLSVNPNDTSVLFNAALTCGKMNDNLKAKGYWQALLANGYNKPGVFIELARISKVTGDTIAALSYLQEGRASHPNDIGLVIDELNIYLIQGKQELALEKLTAAIALDPQNANLYFARGTAFDNTKKSDLAEADYLKAIELKSDYFDPHYNLGAMYFNAAAEMANQADKIPFSKQKEFEAAEAKAKAAFEKARPVLEKAHDLQPEDMNTMISLQQLYARLKLNDQMLAMKKKREDAKAKP